MRLNSTAILLVAAGLGLGGCATYGPYGGSGVSIGYNSGYGGYGGYGSPYGSRYGYGYSPYGYAGYSPYGSRYAYGYDPYRSYYGWYDDFYYPGTGYYVYNRYRQPRVWTDAQRRYWTERRSRYSGTTGTTVVQAPVTQNWGAFENPRRQVRLDNRANRIEQRQANRTMRVTRAPQSTRSASSTTTSTRSVDREARRAAREERRRRD